MILRRDDRDEDERKALELLGDEFRELQERHRNDPPVELLRAASAGVLPDDLQAAADKFLAGSEWGRAIAEGAEAAETSMDPQTEAQILARIRGAARKEQKPRAARLFIWRLAIASAAVLAVAFVALWRFDSQNHETPAVKVAPVASELPSHPTTALSIPVFVLSLDKPPVKLTASALLTRGSAENSRFLDDMAPALKAYSDGDFVEAGKQFAALTVSYPKSTEAHFYLAVSRLFAADYPGAIQALESARKIGDVSFAPDISWYLAIAYERARRPVDARAELESLCNGTSAYAERACKAKEQLRSDLPH